MAGVIAPGWHRKLWSKGIGEVWRTEERVFLCGLVVLIAGRAVAWCRRYLLELGYAGWI